MTPAINHEQLKQALVEVLAERRDLLREVMEELFEDAGLLKAMREGETGETVSEEEVMKVLRGSGDT